MQRIFVIFAILSLIAASVPVETAYAKNRPQEIVVRIVNPDMSVRSSFSVVTANDAGGMSVAVADLGGTSRAFAWFAPTDPRSDRSSRMTPGWAWE